MAKRGVEAWDKYYKNRNNIKIIAKNSNPFYSSFDTTKKAGNLNIGEVVIYDDENSNVQPGNLKIAFKFTQKERKNIENGNNIYYSSIDNFFKPALATPQLSPKYFNLENMVIVGNINYFSQLIKQIESKSDILGQSLTEYLIILTEYAFLNNSSEYNLAIKNFSEIELKSLPWGAINSYFSELVGPLACVSGNCIGFPTNLNTAEIYIAPDSNNLYDYEIRHNNQIYRISAKAGKGISNTLKPLFIIQELEKITTDRHLNYLKSTDEYEILNILAYESAKLGPLVAFNRIYPNILNSNALNELVSLYRKNSDSLNFAIVTNNLIPFIDKYKNRFGNKNISLGFIRYICETELEQWFKISSHNKILVAIFKKYISYSNIMLVKTICGPKIKPVFTLTDRTFFTRNKRYTLSLRNKNDSVARVSDKLGINIL